MKGRPKCSNLADYSVLEFNLNPRCSLKCLKNQVETLQICYFFYFLWLKKLKKRYFTCSFIIQDKIINVANGGDEPAVISPSYRLPDQNLTVYFMKMRKDFFFMYFFFFFCSISFLNSSTSDKQKHIIKKIKKEINSHLFLVIKK